MSLILGNDGTAFGDVQLEVSSAVSSAGDADYNVMTTPPLRVTVLEGDPLPGFIVTVGMRNRHSDWPRQGLTTIP